MTRCTQHFKQQYRIFAQRSLISTLLESTSVRQRTASLYTWSLCLRRSGTLTASMTETVMLERLSMESGRATTRGERTTSSLTLSCIDVEKVGEITICLSSN